MAEKGKAALILALGKPKGAPSSDDGSDVKGAGNVALAKALIDALDSKDPEQVLSAFSDLQAAVDED